MTVFLRASQRSHDLSVEPKNPSRTADGNQPHLPTLSWFKAHRGSGGDVKPHATRRVTVEFQCAVRLAEMVMRAHLNRPVTGVGDHKSNRIPVGVQRDFVRRDDHLSRNQFRTVALD